MGGKESQNFHFRQGLAVRRNKHFTVAWSTVKFHHLWRCSSKVNYKWSHQYQQANGARSTSLRDCTANFSKVPSSCSTSYHHKLLPDLSPSTALKQLELSSETWVTTRNCLEKLSPHPFPSIPLPAHAWKPLRSLKVLFQLRLVFHCDMVESQSPGHWSTTIQ